MSALHIVLNGKETEIPAGWTLLELLESLQIKPQMVACELNEKIVRRAEYAGTKIAEKDRIEVLQMIGGG